MIEKKSKQSQNRVQLEKKKSTPLNLQTEVTRVTPLNHKPIH